MFSTPEPHSMPSLHDASRIGKLEIIANYISEGVDLNAKDHNGKPPLIIAAFFGHVEAVDMLLLAGADVNAVDERGVSALMWAAAGGYSRTMQCLIDHGASINQTDPGGQTALIWAAKHSQKNSIRFLLAHGANVNLRAANGDNALIWPAANGKLAIIKMLIAAGIEVNTDAPALYRPTPLSKAVKNGHHEAAKMLIEGGADIDAIDENWTALGYAVLRQDSRTVKLLLAYGPKIEGALFLAAGSGHTKIIKLLLATGTDVGHRNRFAICKAAFRGHKQIVSLLLANGADMNATISYDYSGERTVLQCAAQSGNKDLVAMLFDKGADSEVPDRLEKLLLLAVGSDKKEMLEFLIAKGANVNARISGFFYPQQGETALEIVIQRAARSYKAKSLSICKEFVKVLLTHGADPYAKDAEGENVIAYAVDRTNGLNPGLIKWLLQECAWLRRRHAMCFYARRYPPAEAGTSVSLSVK